MIQIIQAVEKSATNAEKQSSVIDDEEKAIQSRNVNGGREVPPWHGE